jgi:hypothetical protein
MRAVCPPYVFAHGINLQIKAEWGNSENNRRAKFYRLTVAGRKHPCPIWKTSIDTCWIR